MILKIISIEARDTFGNLKKRVEKYLDSPDGSDNKKRAKIIESLLKNGNDLNATPVKAKKLSEITTPVSNFSGNKSDKNLLF